jgi:hypothetical protein
MEMPDMIIVGNYIEGTIKDFQHFDGYKKMQKMNELRETIKDMFHRKQTTSTK